MGDFDQAWAVTPTYVRYALVGEQGDGTLLVRGHKLTALVLNEALTEAGYGHVLMERTVAALPQVETWVRRIQGCSAHRWVPWWVRDHVIGSADRLRHAVYGVLWRRWKRRHVNPGVGDVPRWLNSVAWPWRPWSSCPVCQVVSHYRNCAGCGLCTARPDSKKPPMLWDWSAPAGRPQANAFRRGYQPVTVIDLGVDR